MAMDERTAAFRTRYRTEEIPGWYRGRAHLCATVILSLLVITAALAELDSVRPWEWLTVPLMFVVANLVEYAGHRGPMHRRVRGLELIHRRHAQQHHRFFTARSMSYERPADMKAVLFPLVLVSFYLGLIAIPLCLLLARLVSANVGWLALAVSVAYFLNYELLHFAYHAPAHSVAARLPLVRRLQQLHRLHHEPELMQRGNFNITYPIGDWLFGTLHRPATSR